MRRWGASLAVLAALAGAAPAAAAERLCDEHAVPMADGTRLHAWVSRLSPDQPRPVLFMMDSYSRGGRAGEGPSSDNACPEVIPDDYVPQYLSQKLVERFTLVQVAYRGTGSSEGSFDFTGPATQADVLEAVDWAAKEPWSTGRVVVAGESGTGFAGFHALRSPHVKAALLMTSCPDMYRCVYRGGLYNGLAEVYLAATAGGYAAGLSGRQRLGLGPGDPAAFGRAAADSKAHATFDDFWAQRSSLEHLRDVRVPVLLTTDLHDIVSPFDALQSLPDVRFNFGGGHLARDTAVVAGGARYRRLVRRPTDRFVAHYGLGERNGARRDPRVTLTVGTGGFTDFKAGRLLVRRAAAWPLRTTRWTPLFLAPDGALAPAPGEPGTDSVSLAAGPFVDIRTVAFATGGAPEEADGLSFQTPELERDLEVTGPLGLRLFATASGDFDWVVRVEDVHPDGHAEWVTDGALRASLRAIDPGRSLQAGGAIVRPWHTFAAPAAPAGLTEYELEVIPTANVFRAGHRLRLTLMPRGTGSITVAHGRGQASALTLPVIPRRCQKARRLTDDTPEVRCARSLADSL